ncbi:hypothetical protein L6R29_09630 [Myxococcota bacterium]|nr:hypothetical protein [Myxococcota bacterium]
MFEPSAENHSQPTPKRPYHPPTIQTEPLFENNALESAGKSGDRCFEFNDPCNEDCLPQPS